MILVHCLALLTSLLLQTVSTAIEPPRQRTVYALMRHVELIAEREGQSRTLAGVDPEHAPLLPEIESSDAWVRMRIPSGVEGWIRKSDSTIVPVPDLTDAEGNSPHLQGFDNITLPRPLRQPLPDAVRVRPDENGRAVIAVVIEKNGSVGASALLVSSGNQKFDANSLRVMKKRRFVPPESSGEKVFLLCVAITTFQGYR